MNLKSKYDIGDEVVCIGYDHNYEWENCKLCAGTGNISLNDVDRICPDCYGKRGERVSRGVKWLIRNHYLTVGLIRLEQVIKLDEDGIAIEGLTEYKNEYMCLQTGIGSGTIHREEKLFPSVGEAKIECEKRNREGVKP